MARLSWPRWLVIKWDIFSSNGSWTPYTVTHPSTNRARCRATSLIDTNALPLSQTATLYQAYALGCQTVVVLVLAVLVLSQHGPLTTGVYTLRWRLNRKKPLGGFDNRWAVVIKLFNRSYPKESRQLVRALLTCAKLERDYPLCTVLSREQGRHWRTKYLSSWSEI